MLEVPGSSTGQLAGKKRRRNRWSDAPPTMSSGDVSASAKTEDAVVASASAPSTGCPVPPGQGGGSGAGQQLTPAQLQQIKEQIEVIP